MTRELRRQRQRDTIVSAAADGDLARATALLAEHAVEFPQDGGLLGAANGGSMERLQTARPDRVADARRGTMEDLAPDITRQRLLLEGFYEAGVDETSIRGYFDHLASTLGLRTYGEPMIYSPEGTGRDENQGFDAFQPLIDSGISLYVWSARRFLAVVIFTCKSFDAYAARRATVEYFRMPTVESQPF